MAGPILADRRRTARERETEQVLRYGDGVLQPTHPRPFRTFAGAAIAVFALTLSACGDGESATPDTTVTTTAPSAGDDVPDLSVEEFEDLTAESGVDVTARDNTFVSDYITVKAGTTVTWTNRGRTEHNVLPVTDGAFEPIEISDLEPGMSASITFDEPGDYPYYCSLHGTKTKGMVGAVRVVE